MTEAGNPPSFNWSISNQVRLISQYRRLCQSNDCRSVSRQAGSSIRACDPLHINVDRAPIAGDFPAYLLTIFSIDDGNEPKIRSVVIDRESRGNGLDWVVDEPIGEYLRLNFRKRAQEVKNVPRVQVDIQSQGRKW
jgi:hypothetical protein